MAVPLLDRLLGVQPEAPYLPLLLNLGLILLGSVVGMNFDTLSAGMKRYGQVMWIIIALITIFFVVRYLRRRAAAKRTDSGSNSDSGSDTDSGSDSGTGSNTVNHQP